jgi:hypothetical protein
MNVICSLRQIHHAAQNPVALDYAQASAVEARIILDLRIGAAFTRMQTLTLRAQIGELKEASTISYGEQSACLCMIHELTLPIKVPVSFQLSVLLFLDITRSRSLFRKRFGRLTYLSLGKRLRKSI